MKTLHHPGIPYNIERKNLKKKISDLDKIEIVPCSEGYGVFSKDEFYWIGEEELGNNRVTFNPKKFEEKGWYFFSPIYLEIELTKKCDLNCLHCYNNSGKGEDFELERLKEILSEFRENGGQKVKYTGGEPLMNKNFEEIVRYTKNIGIRNLELTTNGNLIDKNISKFISKNFSTVNISLHGSNPEFHEEMTRVKGSFKKGLNGYGLLLRGGLTPKINYSVANFNKLDVYYALFLSKDIGNHGIKFSLIKSYGRGKKLERINQLEITLLRNMISVESKKNGIKVERSELFPEGYLNQIETTKFYGCDGLRSKAYIFQKKD
jgi:MoaA/NifB/PqqE/SkfB family radical SAM enzyme